MQTEDDIIYLGMVGVYQCCHCGSHAKVKELIEHHKTCTMKKDNDAALKEQHPYIFRKWYIPKRMMPGIRRYVDHGIKPGDFLTAVFENDLTKALSLADDENLENIQAYASYLYNKTPISCHGSKRKMKDWIIQKTKEKRGVERLKQKQK